MVQYKYLDDNGIEDFSWRSSEDTFRVRVDGADYRLPLDAILTPENIRRFRAYNGVYTDTDIRGLENVCMALNAAIVAAQELDDTIDCADGLIRDIEWQRDLVEMILRPSATDILMSEDAFLYPVPMTGEIDG